MQNRYFHLLFFLLIVFPSTSYLSSLSSFSFLEKMCSSQIHVCCHRNRRLMISFLFLLISNLTQVRFMAEGRTISKLLEVAKKGIEEEKIMVMRMIGSRPPRCDRMCSYCGYCETIRVPIDVDKKERSHFTSATLSIADSRGEDISNYKPISWKCKCCNVIFNP